MGITEAEYQKMQERLNAAKVRPTHQEINRRLQLEREQEKITSRRAEKMLVDFKRKTAKVVERFENSAKTSLDHIHENSVKINIRPISVNEAWQGQRFKTKAYLEFEKAALRLLPQVQIPEGELRISLEYGFSSRQRDVDNPTKCVLDILQKRYGFNDNRIMELNLRKMIVPKGAEYFSFAIYSHLG